jgi:inhibitor of KinA sporulation pathway (predicted exonuclease)
MDYVIVDLEATCWEQGTKVEKMEIIEIGAVYVEGERFDEISEFQTFVKPSINPIISDFCSKLTHIKQTKIDAAPSFGDGFQKFINWIGDNPFRLCSWGDFDYQLFCHELKRCSMEWPEAFLGHINLKKVYADVYNTRQLGLRGALQKQGMSFEGAHHRGIDDARNIVRIAKIILPVFAS